MNAGLDNEVVCWRAAKVDRSRSLGRQEWGFLIGSLLVLPHRVTPSREDFAQEGECLTLLILHLVPFS